MNNQEAAESISKILSHFDSYDVIEILSNVLIYTGISRMKDLGKIEITSRNIIDIVMQDKKQNGETLQNALAHQGLVMHLWLEKGNVK